MTLFRWRSGCRGRRIPWRALTGWAEASRVELRTVIGTDDQLVHADSGIAQKLAPDDIPPTSSLPGRDRLALIAPARAEQLANTADSALSSLLPSTGERRRTRGPVGGSVVCG